MCVPSDFQIVPASEHFIGAESSSQVSAQNIFFRRKLKETNCLTSLTFTEDRETSAVRLSPVNRASAFGEMAILRPIRLRL